MKVSRRYVMSASVLGLALAVLGLFQACSPGFSVVNSRLTSGLGDLPVPVVVTYSIPPIPFEKLSLSGFDKMTEKTDPKNFWEYVPKYPLYSYGAEKRRWIYLPYNTQIDNADPDGWGFPKGTVLWKLFSLNGRKVETRVLEKMSDVVGISAWRASVYLWRADQTDADLLTDNTFYSRPPSEKLVYEAGRLEASYVVSMPNQCVTCHQSSTDGSLGLNYLQQSNMKQSRDVFALSREKLLKYAVVRYDEILGSDLQSAAIGYLQGNCVHCHDGSGRAPHDFKHRSTVGTATDEALLLSAGRSSGLIVPGSSNTSRLYMRFSGGSMPPRTISVDPDGATKLRAWIDSM